MREEIGESAVKTWKTGAEVGESYLIAKPKTHLRQLLFLDLAAGDANMGKTSFFAGSLFSPIVLTLYLKRSSSR